MSTQFLTCKFKIHNPSAYKQTVMDYALAEYTRAYKALLGHAQVNQSHIEANGRYKEQFTGMSIASVLPRPQVVLHSSAKDSLVQDVAGNLASFFELLQNGHEASFPTGRDPSSEADALALEHFTKVGSDNDDYNESKSRYLEQARGSTMPLYFCRADGASQTNTGRARNRNFSLLWNTQKRQFLAVMWLLPAGHELSRPLNVKQGNLVRLDTGEVFRSNPKTAIMVPLEIGRNGWQEWKFLQPALQNGGPGVKTAFLVRDDRRGEYYLHVSFEFKCPKPYKPGTYLGIDKGILLTAAYAIVDGEGQVLTLGHFDDELRALQIKHGREREKLAKDGNKITWRHFKHQAYANILHNLANDLIALAQKHKAQIVVEALSIQVKGGRVVSRFRKLDKILEYKCRLAGVPFRQTFAAYSSVICHRCGENLDRNDRLITCSHCGYHGHSDDNAAVNIARRALYRKDDWLGGYREFHRSFANVSAFQTEK